MGTLAAVRKLHARPVEAVEHWRAWSLGGGNLFVKTPDPSTQQRIELLVPSHRICWCSRFVAGFLVYREHQQIRWLGTSSSIRCCVDGSGVLTNKLPPPRLPARQCSTASTGLACSLRTAAKVPISLR